MKTLKSGTRFALKQGTGRPDRVAVIVSHDRPNHMLKLRWEDNPNGRTVEMPDTEVSWYIEHGMWRLLAQ